MIIVMDLFILGRWREFNYLLFLNINFKLLMDLIILLDF